MNLLLFFTRGVSLELWEKQGLFDREKLIYEEHLKKKNFKKIFWLTYGHKDLSLSKKLKKAKRLHKSIHIIEMPKLFSFPKIGSYVYSLIVPFLYPKIFKNIDLIKTNQIDGAWSAVILKWVYKIPLAARTGYCISQLCCSQNPSSIKCKWFKLIEKFVYKYSDVNIVTSKHSLNYLANSHKLNKKNLKILYNYISNNFFQKKIILTKNTNKILFVGRLDPEKNLFNLIKAIAGSNITLDIYGQGKKIKNKLIEFSIKHKSQVNFLGTLPNKFLPNIYKNYSYYILPSNHEGMPKTLLEAMASGCLCIGTDVPGINEIIEHNVNGILSKSTSSKDISKAIKLAMKIKEKEILIKRGISKIKHNFSLTQITNKEFLILKDLVDGK